MDIPTPKKARELQQILMASQWMSRSIPDYNNIVAHLQDIFEVAMKSQPKRTKSVANRVSLAKYGWNDSHEQSFKQLKLSIQSTVRLAYPDGNKLQCVFCDASYACSSGIVTQIPVEDSEKPFHEQKHEHLGFVGHRFSKSELNWATIDKEAFAIKDTLRKLSYLLHMNRPFRLFTDHQNLISMYNPIRCSKQSAERLIRWGIELRDFNYTIYHIPGEHNHWADLISRCGGGFPNKEPPCQVRSLRIIKDKHHDDDIPLNPTFRVQPFLILCGHTLLRLLKSNSLIFLIALY